MTDEKWGSPTGRAISSSETDLLTKRPENVTCGDVSNVGDYRFFLGREYQTLEGKIVKFVEVKAAGTLYEIMMDEDGVHRYTSRDFGRVTGTSHETPDPRNIDLSKIKRALAQQQPDAELLEAARQYMEAVKALGEQSGYKHQTYFEAPILKAPPAIGKEVMERWKDLNDTGVNLSEAIARAEQKGGV